jgi:hypothetical protein
MKQLLAILFAVVLGFQQTYAQDSKKLESFRANVLPQYSLYFTQAQLTENGLLDLNAIDKYILLADDSKNNIMLKITAAWNDSLVLVHYGSKRELWGWNSGTGKAKLLDEWDMALPPAADVQVVNSQNTVLHPWFFYGGGQVLIDSQQNLAISLNARLGFYLLLNRWDFATTFSVGSSGNVDATGTPWSNIGVMSRVHFPIKKSGIIPNIGAEITLASFGETETSYVPSLVLGVSWFVGIGHLDIGIKIGDITTGMGGYTMYPGMKHVK